MIRVLLADDQALIRAGFRALLEHTDDILVVGEAADGEQAVGLAASARADVVLMDIRMPGVDGLEATRRIADSEDLAGVRVLILTTFESDDYVYEALRAGASGFVVKDTEPAELVQAVRVVAAGDALLSPSVTRRLIADIAAKGRLDMVVSDYRVDRLTDRERQVLTLVGRGLSNDEIAAELFLSPFTAKTHVSRIMNKLAARDRAQLVVIAYETRLVTVGAGHEPGTPWP
ncbi:response regulator transcription factor [Kutzneria buriramensis]|uniref:DNA-binding NarL/FixJ family response regulator n=1 Tax=Kutzneria buriramensis TaxID=1045776 RepID=A0A3E0HKS4_9PSEU|nr:response regulator transcription factor [Kutzneria buriramensis]REH47017.1 DNA-binding NarL/FixJ family response regulator [Kutzneria buriramensis]